MFGQKKIGAGKALAGLCKAIGQKAFSEVGLASGNEKYSQRFGYVFLVCATGKSALEMLNLLEARINNSPEEELQIAQQEQQKIMLLRLDKMFE